MTDSHADAQSPSAVISLHGLSHWNLLATEVAYPLAVEMAGKHYEIYGVLQQPYDADDLIEAINLNRGGVRRAPGSLVNIKGDEQKFAALTSKLFVRLEGTSSTDPAVHRQYLEAHYMLKVKLCREGLGNVFIDDPAVTEVPVAEAEQIELLPLALDVTNDVVVATKQELWDSIGRKKVELRMKHHLRPETEKDWHRWSRTSSEKFSKPTNVWTEGINWWDRAALYDSMILRIEGMCLNTATCNDANKADWVGRVPAWHKLLVIGEVFDEARVKN